MIRRRGRKNSATASVAAPADKRFRRPDVRPGRRRRIGQLAWRAGRFVVVFLASFSVAGWAAHAVHESSVLRVDRVVVRGNVRLSSGDVEALVAGIRGEKILTIDFDHYRERVMDSPWVAEVTFWRVLPSTVEIQLAERVPMVVARLGQHLYLVDNAGIVIDEFGPQYRDFDLPIVDGLVSTAARKGPMADIGRVRLIGRFLDAVAARPDLAKRVSQLNVSNARDLVVLLDGDPAMLHVGDDHFINRLQMYLDLSPTLQEQFVDIDYVDLRFDERLYVGSRGRADVLAAPAHK